MSIHGAGGQPPGIFQQSPRIGGRALVAWLFSCGLLLGPAAGAAAQEAGAPTEAPVATGESAGAATRDGRPVELELTLGEAMRMALENNLQIEVVAYDRRASREGVTTARGAFEPLFTFGLPGAGNFLGLPGGAEFGGAVGAGGLGYSDVRQPTATTLAGADVATNSGFAGRLNLGQTFRFGLRYDVTYDVARSRTNSFFQSLNPSWDNTFAVTVSQPLLRGRGEAGTAAELLLARAEVAVSDATFRSRVLEVLATVEQGYWELVFAEGDLEVKEASLRLAEDQLERTRAQVEVGLIAPVEATQAEVQVAAREAEAILARNALEDARDRLRGLLQADRLPDGWETSLRPAMEPERSRPVVDLDTAVATALERRPEIGEAEALVGLRGVEVEAGQDALLPRVDLVGQVASNGIGGDRILREGFPGEVVGEIPGGYGDALDQLFSMDFVSWRIGVNVELPLGNRTAEGRYARATLEEDRAKTELERLRQQVVLETRSAWRGIQAATESLQSTRKARELAERQLEIETDRFDVGMSTNFEVLRLQRDLTEARTAELRALTRLRLAESELLRAMGTLLEHYGISIE